MRFSVSTSAPVKKVLPTSALLFTLSTGFLLGQTTKLTDKAAFSPNAIKLSFNALHRGTQVSDLYAAYGLRFLGEGDSVPTAQDNLISPGFVPTIDTVISNEPKMGTSANKALILQFKHPLVRVGFTLENDTKDTVASIQAFTAKGGLLGTVQQIGTDEKRSPFGGVETSHPEGVSTLTLDYGNSDAPEQISELIIDYRSARSFKTCLAQIAHGRAGTNLLQTILQIQTLQEGTGARIKLTLFDPKGNPLALSLNGATGSQFEFIFPFSGFRQLITDGPDEKLAVGYACIESNHPLVAHAIYRTSSSRPDQVVEAGLQAEEAKTIFVASVEKNSAAALDTGIAVVNVGGKETGVLFSPIEETGASPKELRNALGIRLAPGEQRAFFLSQLCKQPPSQYQASICTSDFLAERDFRGSLRIMSPEPIVVTTVRTVGGIAVASLPAGSTQR